MSSTPPAFAEADFRKASASNPDKQCVRVARRDGWVELRDDKKVFGAADDHRLVFTTVQFDAFQAGVRAGETTDLCLALTRHSDGTYRFRSTVAQPPAEAVELEFTEGEVAAFFDGVRRGEFDRDTTANMAISA